MMDIALDEDLLALLLADDDADAPEDIARNQKKDFAPLSFAQQRLWYLQQLNPSGTAYNLPRVLVLSGDLRIATLETALQKVTARHDILRTCFREIDGEPVQVVDEKSVLPLFFEDVSSLSEENKENKENKIKECINAHAAYPFDLAKTPAIVAKLLKVSDQKHLLLITMHHIVSDAWSNPILIRDLVDAYLSAATGIAKPLPRPSIQFADFAHWQRHEYAASRDCLNAAEYWKNYLGSDLQPLEIPREIPPAEKKEPIASRHDFHLSGELTQAFDEWCRRESIPHFVGALGVWQLLLWHYSGQDDFCIGVPSAGRNRGETQDLVGFFVNTQVYRARIDSHLLVREFFQRLRDESIAALTHADYPFELYLKNESQNFSSASNPFRALFNWQVAKAEDGPLRLGELDIDFLPPVHTQPKCDISLDILYSQSALSCTFEYDAAYFRAETVERMAKHWQHLLLNIVSGISRVGELALLDSCEKRDQINAWNREPKDFIKNRCIHKLIEEKAAQTPDAVALCWRDTSHASDIRITYQQLNARANLIAHKLMASGVGPETLVGIAAERSPEMVIALLAILKSGGAYVPLDPTAPAERLAYILEDSGVAILLMQRHLLGNLQLSPRINALYIEQFGDDFSADNPDAETHPDNPAYMIYTSGSTGKPKGALLTHRNVLRLFDATAHWFEFGADDVWTLFHSYAFDFSVWEIFGPLIHGGRLIIVPYETSRSPEAFYALLREEKVTVLNQTPSAFKQLMQVAITDTQSLPALRYVIFGGEALDVKSLLPWFERFGDQQPKLINMYGITETTVHVTYRPITMSDVMQSGSPIGEPIPDLSWYLLHGGMQIIPRGSRGELYIGRAGLARGYHSRPGLTAERFIPDPFDTAGGRLYRTGDLAHCRENRVIEYAGRIDQQIKIRGFRIEIGEIEACLEKLDDVNAAVVLAQEGPNGQQLIAYIVPCDSHIANGADEISGQFINGLRSAVRAQLPDYMVPAYFVLMEKIPLTLNGKLDKRALPAATKKHSNYEAPSGDIETAFAQVWAKVLGVEQISRSDNFFDLGGNSLAAVQVMRLSKDIFDGDIALADFLANPVVSEFVRAALAKHREIPTLRLSEIDGGCPLFCLPGLHVNSAEYFSLLENLKQERSVYSFPCYSLTTSRWDGLTLEQLAARYKEKILALANGGPCALLGWSFGGDLAFETARQLSAGGIAVQAVLIDVFEPSPYIANVSAEARQHAQRLLERWISNSTMQKYWRQLLNALNPVELDALLQYLLRNDGLPSDGADYESEEYSLWVLIDNARMMHRYEHKPLHASAHVWVAEQSIRRKEKPAIRDWSEFVTDIELNIVPSVDHRSILNSAALSKGICESLRDFDREAQLEVDKH